MKNQALSFYLSLAAAFGVCLSAFAAPVGVADQANGLLASPLSETASQDPVVQQAVKWIKSKRAVTQFVKVAPGKNASAHKDLDHVMILGYPEAVPM